MHLVVVCIALTGACQRSPLGPATRPWGPSSRCSCCCATPGERCARRPNPSACLVPSDPGFGTLCSLGAGLFSVTAGPSREGEGEGVHRFQSDWLAGFGLRGGGTTVKVPCKHQGLLKGEIPPFFIILGGIDFPPSGCWSL